MFCYDPIVLCFFFIYAGAIAIAILGPVWSSQASQLLCHASLSRSINTVSGFFWFYVLGGVFVISLSWCVEAGRRKHQPIPGIGAAAQQMPRQSAIQRLFFPQSPVVNSPLSHIYSLSSLSLSLSPRPPSSSSKPPPPLLQPHSSCLVSSPRLQISPSCPLSDPPIENHSRFLDNYPGVPPTLHLSPPSSLTGREGSAAPSTSWRATRGRQPRQHPRCPSGARRQQLCPTSCAGRIPSAATCWWL